MAELDIKGVLSALESEGVSFVLIGAVALAAHGPIRATEDVDIVPDPDPENLRVLGNALVEMHATLASDPTRAIDPELRSALEKGDGLTLETVFGGVDVVQRLPGVPAFQDLVADASRMRLLGIDVYVCSRRHLREMKLARGSHRDLADVEDLDSLEDTG
jgi:hypothetical protein